MSFFELRYYNSKEKNSLKNVRIASLDRFISFYNLPKLDTTLRPFIDTKYGLLLIPKNNVSIVLHILKTQCPTLSFFVKVYTRPRGLK